MVLEGHPRDWKIEDEHAQGTHVYHRQVNVTQKKQSKALVLNGKSTSFSYPDAEFWKWNNRILVKPTSTNTSRMQEVFEVGFPSVYQTSDHLRFDLAERPRSIKTTSKQHLGLGHTARASKHVFNHVWSVFYRFVVQAFTMKFGAGRAKLRYWMSVISTVFTPHDPPKAWTVTLQVPSGWEKDQNVQAFFKGKPDKYDIMKIELNCFFHILLLDVRFPGEVAMEAKLALKNAMDLRLCAAVSRVQDNCSDSLRERLLDIIGYHSILVQHLEQQKKIAGPAPRITRPSLADVKLLELPPGHNLEDLSSDEDSTDDEAIFEEPRNNPGFRLQWKRKPRKRKSPEPITLEKKADVPPPAVLERNNIDMKDITVPAYEDTRELSSTELAQLKKGKPVLYDYDDDHVLYFATVRKVHRRSIVLYFPAEDTVVTLEKTSSAFLYNIRVPLNE